MGNFEAHLDRVVVRLATAGRLSERPGICIDKTLMRRHDSRPGPELVSGAIRGNREACAKGHIVTQCNIAGEWLTLAWAPVGSGDHSHDKFRSPFDACAKRGLSIGSAELDRELYDTRSIKELVRCTDLHIIP